MSNKITEICKKDICQFLKDESENISIVRNHVDLIKDTRNHRKITRLFGFDENNGSHGDIQNIKREIYEMCQFNYGDSIDASFFELLDTSEDISSVEDSLLEIFASLSDAQKKDYSIFISLKNNGIHFINKHQLVNLRNVAIPVSFHCPICDHDTEIKLSILAISEDYSVKSACSHCKHSEKEKTSCKCELCKKNRFIFNLAKLIEDRLNNSKTNANKRLQTAIDKEELVENDVDLSSLFAKFTSMRGTLSVDSKMVVQKAIEIFSILGRFEQNTYQFTKNIVGEDKASAVAGELIKAGFFYKIGFIPKVNFANIPPSFGFSTKKAEFINIDEFESLHFSNKHNELINERDSSFFINQYFDDTFYVHFDVKPNMWSVFNVNHFVLENDVYGGITNSDAIVDKTESGSILKNKQARESYLKEKTANIYPHIFPDIKIGRLFDIEDLRRIMTVSTISILEDFEASIVCYDAEFEPKKVYLNKSSYNIDVIKNSVVLILKAKAIEIALI